MSKKPSHQLYKIGAVERASGVPAVTIRMWERRYEALTPERTESGGRLYTREQIERLSKLRALVNAGHAISTIASLDDNELDERLSETARPAQTPHRPLTLALVGSNLVHEWHQGLDEPADWEVVAQAASIPIALQNEATQADILVAELDALPPGEAVRVRDLMQHFGARHAALVFHFATREDLRQLQRWNIQTVKAPVRREQIHHVVASLANAAPADDHTATTDPMALALKPPPPHRFSTEELQELATQSAIVKCECPEHLVELVNKLTAFETYSRNCQSANRADAALHMLLYGATAQVRRIMEDMLAEVIAAERGNPND